jgi:hypothetical protein
VPEVAVQTIESPVKCAALLAVDGREHKITGLAADLSRRQFACLFVDTPQFQSDSRAWDKGTLQVNAKRFSKLRAHCLSIVNGKKPADLHELLAARAA